MVATKEWAQQNFGECQLGDKRRTNRLVRLAGQVANNPSASLPNQTATWSDLKAAYNFFDRDEVTFEAIAGPHWELTKQRRSGRYLVIGDTTEINFGKDRDLADVSPVGKNGTGKGFLLHNALLVGADTGEIVGVAGQKIHHRKRAPRKENRLKRLQRNRESEIWGDVVDQIGPPPDGVQWIQVFDRGGDNFEVYCHLLLQQSDWVIRCAQMRRYILTGENDEQTTLADHLLSLTLLGTYELEVRARPKQSARRAMLEVRVGKLKMPPPREKSPWLKKLDAAPIPMHVVHVQEVNAPEGTKPISWVLLTSLPVSTFTDAWKIIEYYEMRWLIEEYHKALKTGCRVTHRQLKSSGRLEAMVGLMSVVALRLLQLKSLARTSPDIPAQRVVPSVWLQMLKAVSPKINRVHDITVRQFYREVAKLGGFLARKGDGEPGWITTWRGWEKLNTLVTAAMLAKQLNLQTLDYGKDKSAGRDSNRDAKPSRVPLGKLGQRDLLGNGVSLQIGAPGWTAARAGGMCAALRGRIAQHL